jgi:hypothetical protein
LARLQLEQPLGIDGDGIGLHRRRGGDGAGDDFALHQQALDARVDQAGAELGQIKNSDHQRQQAGDVEKDDAPAQTRKGDADEEVPALQQELGAPPSPAFDERRAVVGLERSGGGLQHLRRAPAEIRKGPDDEAMPGLQ